MLFTRQIIKGAALLALGTAFNKHTAVEAKKARIGTNIGGWLVVEPWITPSLFYRWLGKNNNDEIVALDSYTLCESLGPVEGNKFLRAHWDTWYTEQDIKDLADREVEIVRLPVGDWTLDPYGPYIGCMDGSVDYVQWFLDMAAKYNLKVLMDVHTAKGSQNGFDNSGMTRKLIWDDDGYHFHHWSVTFFGWSVEQDEITKAYSLNY